MVFLEIVGLVVTLLSFYTMGDYFGYKRGREDERIRHLKLYGGMFDK